MTPLEILATGAMMAAVVLTAWGDPWRAWLVIVAAVLCLIADSQGVSA